MLFLTTTAVLGCSRYPALLQALGDVNAIYPKGYRGPLEWVVIESSGWDVYHHDNTVSIVSGTEKLLYQGGLEDSLRHFGMQIAYRDWVCQNPDWALRAGLSEGPRDDTRTVACFRSDCAIDYAYDVDRRAHPETRKACETDPHFAQMYLGLDEVPVVDGRLRFVKWLLEEQ